LFADIACCMLLLSRCLYHLWFN